MLFPRFYWSLSRFQPFFNEFSWFLLDFEPFSAVCQMIFNDLYWILSVFGRFGLTFIGFYWILNRFRPFFNDFPWFLLDAEPFSAVCQ